MYRSLCQIPGCEMGLFGYWVLFIDSRCLTDIQSLKLLYYALVRPHLEYCSVISSHHPLCLKTEIERIQRRFWRLSGTLLGYRFLEFPTQERLVNSELNCPKFLERNNFTVPTCMRSVALFAISTAFISYIVNSTLLRIQHHENIILLTSTSTLLFFLQE
ncbi:hypothetical protein J6590_026104 [Homalodisca vitripennis]|nr:hypothetical protein J6590_026104 [Homalodisca vitripennis]